LRKIEVGMIRNVYAIWSWMPTAGTQLRNLITITKVWKASSYEPGGVLKRSFCLQQSAHACGLTPGYVTMRSH